MYLWLGLKLPAEYEKKIRKVVRKFNRKFDFSEIAFDLPQHISLKIAFECSDYMKIVRDLEDNVISKYKPFTVKSENIEVNQGIVWIQFFESKILDDFHNDIIKFLEDNYKIQAHEFDLEFIYHTTLIHDDNARYEDLLRLKRKISRKIKLEEVDIKKVIFGISEKNLPKTFKIVKEVEL